MFAIRYLRICLFESGPPFEIFRVERVFVNRATNSERRHSGWSWLKKAEDFFGHQKWVTYTSWTISSRVETTL